MYQLTPRFLRSIPPPYRVRPRSTVTLMHGHDEPRAGFYERLRRTVRRLLKQDA